MHHCRTPMSTADVNVACVQKKHKSFNTRQGSGRPRKSDFCFTVSRIRLECMLQCAILLWLISCVVLPKSSSYDFILDLLGCIDIL